MTYKDTRPDLEPDDSTWETYKRQCRERDIAPLPWGEWLKANQFTYDEDDE